LPLSEKARIEVYLPDLAREAYQELLDDLEREFTHTFGGCSIYRRMDGTFLSGLGHITRDRINLICTDAPFTFDNNLQLLSDYADHLRDAAFAALEEEAVLVAVIKVFHSE